MCVVLCLVVSGRVVGGAGERVLTDIALLGGVQAPLFLSFDNNDPAGSPFKVIFKVGDDLRQDILILQMFGS